MKPRLPNFGTYLAIKKLVDDIKNLTIDNIYVHKEVYVQGDQLNMDVCF